MSHSRQEIKDFCVSAATTAVVDECLSNPSDAGTVANFSQDIDQSNRNIRFIKDSSISLGEMRDQFCHRSAMNPGIHSNPQLAAMLAKTNECILATKQSLSAMKRETEMMSSRNPGRPLITQIREEVTRGLRDRFVGSANEYQSAQKRYMFEIEEEIRDEIYLGRPNVLDEGITAALRNPRNICRPSSSDAYTIGVKEFITPSELEKEVASITLKYPDWIAMYYSLEELRESLYYYLLLAQTKTERSAKEAVSIPERVHKTEDEPKNNSKVGWLVYRYRYCCLVIPVVGAVILIIYLVGLFGQK